MASITKSELMTADQFFEWVHLPQHRDRHFELDRGEVVEMPPPGERHGVVCGNVGWILNSFVRQRNRGYVCTNDTGVVVETNPDTVRGIDVTLYDESRRYDELTPKYATHLPTLAAEVLSPDDRAGKLMRRVVQFLQKGISLVWLIDPEDREVTVYRSGREPYVLGVEDEITGDETVPDFRCRVADFFRMPGE
jgi:Uma2 family endonuclease